MSRHEAAEQPDQAAAIPIRRVGANVEVCLIRRRGRHRWGIPKGFIDNGDSAADAALTEAREEAGLLGRIDAPAVGGYAYEKWGGRLLVAVHVMVVDDVLPVWDEMDVRERRWTTPAEANRLLRDHPAWDAWSLVCDRLDEYAPVPKS